MRDGWRRGWRGLGWCWVRGKEFSLPQAPLKKFPLGSLLNQGPELEEEVPDPEELDWWSKYYASLQELRGQVGPGAGPGPRPQQEAEAGKGPEGAQELWCSTVFRALH